MNPGLKILSIITMLLLCSICSHGQSKSLEELKTLEEQLDEKQLSIQRERYVLIGSAILIILGVGFYLQSRRRQEKGEREKLLLQIEELKKKLGAPSVASVHNGKGLKLDKAKIEKAIQGKLGESSWIILNLIIQNPSISNKEIADEVSLSLEGVSSSLRRMYANFDIQSASNKKINLIMKAVSISFEE